MYKIVVADDEKMSRERLCRYIEKIPDVQVVASFHNGLLAKKYLESNTVSLIVSDIRMPLMDGLELAKWIKDNRLECDIILVSAYSEFEYAQNAIDFGVKSYLLKPLSVEKVVAAVEKQYREYIERRKALIYTRDFQHEKTESFLKKWVKNISENDVPDVIKGKKCSLIFVDIEKSNLDAQGIILIGLKNIFRFWNVGEVSHLGKCMQRECFGIFNVIEEKMFDIQEMEKMVQELVEEHIEIKNVKFFNTPELLKEFWNSGEIEEDKIIQKVKEYVRKNLKGSVSRDEAALTVYMEGTYFSRYFKKQTGLNFQDYVKKIRMEKAKELLKKGWKVKDVCGEVGYQDRNYFNKMFRQYTGFSPFDYKRQLGLEQGEEI